MLVTPLALATLTLTGLGILESWRLRRARDGITTRVHVNGTRGKSSVTRLIAGGLRASGLRTVAKTTGTNAAMILPDGSELPVYRPTRPNVIEQVRMITTAAAYGAEVLVIECMALQPDLQALTELEMVRSTHGVITNARADHLDVMGPDERAVALALAGTTPVEGTLFTCEERHLDVFERAAADRGATLVAIGAEGRGVTDAELAGFSYTEHRANVALALRVCVALGAEREVALAGMHEATPEPGGTTEHTLDHFGRLLHFVNGFSANDPESTETLWQMAREHFPQVDQRLVVVNCRADRVDRSRQLGEACPTWPQVDRFLLIGSGTQVFARSAVAAGLDPGRLLFAEGQPAAEVFEQLLEQAGTETLILGAGNVAGPGHDVLRLFKNRARPAGGQRA